MMALLTRTGILFEIDGSGSGFIEDHLDEQVYGFHASMLTRQAPVAGPWLGGREVTFEVDAGVVRSVALKSEAASVSAGA